MRGRDYWHRRMFANFEFLKLHIENSKSWKRFKTPNRYTERESTHYAKIKSVTTHILYLSEEQII